MHINSRNIFLLLNYYNVTIIAPVGGQLPHGRQELPMKDHRSSILFQIKYTSSSLSKILSHQLTCILVAFWLMEMGTVTMSFVKWTPECVWNIYGLLMRYVLVALVYHYVSDEVANLTWHHFFSLLLFFAVYCTGYHSTTWLESIGTTHIIIPIHLKQ